MNKSIGVQLVVYGLLLAGLSFLIRHFAQGISRPVLITGLIGGSLCLVWGIRAILGSRGKALPVLTLIPVTFSLLSLTITGWSGPAQGTRSALIATTLLLLLSLWMLVRIAWAGVVFDVPPADRSKHADNSLPGAGKPSRTTAAKSG